MLLSRIMSTKSLITAGLLTLMLMLTGCQVMHAINEETVWALYCGLTLTLCSAANKTYDDVEVFYYGRKD